jgi:hypothetical protein
MNVRSVGAITMGAPEPTRPVLPTIDELIDWAENNALSTLEAETGRPFIAGNPLLWGSVAGHLRSLGFARRAANG